MVATETTQGTDEQPTGETPPVVNAPRLRSRVLGIALKSVVAIIALSATVVVEAKLVAPDPHRQTAISLPLEPASLTRTAASPSAHTFALVEPRSPGGHLVADPALVEDSQFGPLPVIAADGRTPMAAYARPFDANDKRPRIAIVIGGLSVSASNTKLALARLPPSVTLGFVPFASDVQSSVDLAREAGHEVLLEVPMEPFDFPESDPGTNALLAAASGDENIRRLSWSLSRFTGYVGITNLLGARFMSDEAPLAPVLRETARRGLIFVDDGTSRSSLALTAARHESAPIATGTLTLDDTQSKDAVDGKLGELEAEARRNGFAIGVGSPYPVTIARIAAWAESVESRGFAIVPISTLATKPAPAAPLAQAPAAPRARRASAAAPPAAPAPAAHH